MFITKTRYGRSAPDSKKRYVVPIQLRANLIRAHHDCAAHIGRNMTKISLLARYTWPGATSDIERYVKGCPAYALFKHPKPVRNGMLRPIRTTRPFEMLSTSLDRFQKVEATHTF